MRVARSITVGTFLFLSTVPSPAVEKDEVAEFQAQLSEYEALLIKHGAKRLKRENLRELLKHPATTANDYFAAFLLVPNIAWLEKTLILKPESPLFLQRAVAQKNWVISKRLSAAETLVKLQPDNKVGYYLLASVLAEMGKTKKAASTLQMAMAATDYKPFTAEMIQLLEPFLIKHGSSPLGAKMISTFEILNPMMFVGLDIHRELLKKPAVLNETETAVVRKALFEAGIAVSGKSLPLSYVDELVGYATILKSIEGMKDEQISPDNVTKVSDMRIRYETCRAEIIKKTQMMAKWNCDSLNGDTLDSYIDMFRTKGEAAAAEWLVKKHPSIKSTSK
ncbi:MAG: hypothetical protein AB8F34_00825 [Akkermansiaceae bacterium]